MRDRQHFPGVIRMDHLTRYQHAVTFAKSPVLDAACGMGYGAHGLAVEGYEVTAVDIDPDAISMALTWYDDEKVIQWIKGDILARPWGEQKFRTIVCFETLEHLEDAPKAVRLFRESATDDGMLIASVPNQDVMPFDPDNFTGDVWPHKRHYTPAEFDALLSEGGWKVIHRGTQGKTTPVRNGTDSKFLVFTCEPA